MAHQAAGWTALPALSLPVAAIRAAAEQPPTCSMRALQPTCVHRGELLIARQEAGFLLHGLQCLPSACLPQLAGQPRDKRPVAALALVQHRQSAFGAAQQQQQHLALTLMWPEQIAVSVLSEEEVGWNSTLHSWVMSLPDTAGVDCRGLKYIYYVSDKARAYWCQYAVRGRCNCMTPHCTSIKRWL